MQLNSENKNILLTGASGKIGRVLCKQLLVAGYNVIAVVKSDSSLKEMNEMFVEEQRKKTLFVLQSDLTVADARSILISTVNQNFKNLYGIIHNARNLSSLHKDENGHISQENFISDFVLGVYAAYDLIWRLASYKGTSLKRIINISSIYGVVATNTRLYNSKVEELPLHYGVVKSALIHLTKELAVRLAENGVTVNAISYGGVEGRVDEDFKKRYAALCPQSAMLSHDDLAGSVSFLLSGDANFITGHNLIVDGGWTVW